MSVNSRTRRPVARHGQLRRPRAWTQLLKILGIAMTVVLVSGVSVAAYVVYDLSQSFVADAVEIKGQETIPPDIGELKGGINMLLVGTDECEEGYEASFGERCEEDDGGARNDVNMLLHISDEPRRVTVITYPRDLMIPIPECVNAEGDAVGGGYGQINTAYELGGLNCVVQTVGELSGQSIQFAAKVTWNGVMQITDAIGGVPVCIANGLTDEHTGLELGPGVHSLSGWTALQFLRTRYGVGDGSDLGRVSNQQVYMAALARKLVSEEVLTNVGTLLKLANVTLSNVTPSTSLTNPMLLAQIAMAVKGVPFEDINFLRYPVFDDPDNPARVIPDYASAELLWDALAANQQIQVTGGTDAVAADGSAIPVPVDTTPGDGEVIDPEAPVAPGPVALPENIKGQSAGVESCANGVG